MKRQLSLDDGFGYDEDTNHLKVVVVSEWAHDDTRDRFRWHAKVYALSTNCWRTIYYYDSYNGELTTPFRRGLEDIDPSSFATN